MADMNALVASTAINLSTMTVLLRLDKSISLQTIHESFESEEIQRFVQQVTGHATCIIKTKKAFNNSVMFKCQNIMFCDRKLEKPSLKVFGNGSLHITGVKSTCDAIYLGEIFATMFELMCGGNGISGMYNVVHFEIQLMNFYFKFNIVDGKIIDLLSFKDIITTTTQYYATYNNERHAGVIIKSPQFTVIVFETGNVILSSLKTLDQVRMAYEFISGIVATHLKSIMIDVCEKRVPDEGFDYAAYLVLK